MLKSSYYFFVIGMIQIVNVGQTCLATAYPITKSSYQSILSRQDSRKIAPKRPRQVTGVRRVAGKSVPLQSSDVSAEKSDVEDKIYQWFKTYSEVVSLVEKKAFRSVDFSKFIQGSLKAAAAEVDAHSAFLTQDSYKTAMDATSGEFSGIGVSIISKAPEDDALVIVDIIAGGPAEKAGLKSGDKLVEADGHKFRALSTDEAVNTLKGKPGTEIAVKVLRNKKPLEVKVKRDVIKDQNTQSYFFKDHNVYYLSLKLFTENAASHIAELLKLANDGKCKGLVLDLRRNPGGLLQSAIEICSLFLDKHSLVAVTKDRDRKVIDKYFTAREPLLKTDVPIIVLTDHFTASAAEILGGCLKYHSIKSYENNVLKKKRGLMVFLLGTETFGKGSVQEVIPISNGCALKLTTMLYYLPDDVSLQARGIQPDFLIKPKFTPSEELKWISEMYGKEKSLKRHITVGEATGKPEEKDAKQAISKDVKGDQDGDSDADFLKDLDSPIKWEKRQKKELGQDVQVQAAVNMINMLDLARRCDPKLVSSRVRALPFLKQHYLTDDEITIEKVQ